METPAKQGFGKAPKKCCGTRCGIKGLVKSHLIISVSIIWKEREYIYIPPTNFLLLTDAEGLISLLALKCYLTDIK